MVFLLYEKKTLDSLMYDFFPPRILLGVNFSLSFYVFSLDFVVERINFYVSPIIGLVFIF